MPAEWQMHFKNKPETFHAIQFAEYFIILFWKHRIQLQRSVGFPRLRGI